MNHHSFTIGTIPVTAMALGTMYFGTHVPTHQALACLDEAYESGARFWDTANNYAFWAGGVGDESETVIGQWLHSRSPSAREQIVVATKIGARPKVAGAGLDAALGLSPVTIPGQVEDSLRRLRTDHIDILYAHVDDPTVPFEETLGAFATLVERGLVRQVAASNLTAARLAQAMHTSSAVRYEALQQRFTYLAPAHDVDLTPHVVLDDEVANLCDVHHLTRLGYSPLLSGAYTRTDRPMPEGYGHNQTAPSTLHDVASRHGLDAGQTVLSWMTQRPQPVIPVVGVSAPSHVRSAWTAINTPLSSDDMAMLEDARRD